MNHRRSDNIVVYICRNHVVFCPKPSRKVLTPPIDEWLKGILTEHVYLLVGCNRQLGIHRMVKLFQGYSSHTLHADFSALKQQTPSL